MADDSRTHRLPDVDQDFRTGLRELERIGQRGRTVPIDALADLIATDLRERHGISSRREPIRWSRR